MSKELILIIEDDEDIHELLKYNLAKEGYQYLKAASGEKGLQSAKLKQPDLIILDLMLPGIDGLEVCQLLKKDLKTEAIPVIMLTAKGEEVDIVAGLEIGAEDYITKPFSPKVLIARIRTVLRRKKIQKPWDASRGLKIHNLLIHPGRHEVRVEGRTVDLTATEFNLIFFLASHPGWVFTRSQIVDKVRGEDYAVTERAVDVQIVGLRRKLAAAGKYIETIRGVGYRFQE